jgi:hypothetical protein
MQCNNPKTKEPKLTAAMRIIPEWKRRDNEIRQLQDRINSLKHDEDLNQRGTGKSQSTAHSSTAPTVPPVTGMCDDFFLSKGSILCCSFILVNELVIAFVAPFGDYIGEKHFIYLRF